MRAIEIDGSFGEGGGQILRTSLSLSAVTGCPLHIVRVRAKRERPGLLRQHLTAFRAMAEICAADVDGAELGSHEVRFVPGKPRAGHYHFAIGTAGSACLVLQTVLWPLLAADGVSEVTLEGGTHNPQAPPFDFLARTFFPLVQRMGGRIEARLERHGFYPAGGGRITVQIEPNALAPFELTRVGPVTQRQARALISRLPRHVAERELREVQTALGFDDDECTIETVEGGPGNVLLLHLQRDALTETFSAFGTKGVPAERVAANAVREVNRYLGASVPVGGHLADQLIVPLALAGGGAFRTLPLSLHATTNIDIVRRFLDIDVAVRSSGDGATLVEIRSGGAPA